MRNQVTSLNMPTVLVGYYLGWWTLIVAVLVVAPHVTADESDLESFAQRALIQSGDVEAGRVVFESQRSQCSLCHRITGLERSGPNLNGIGAKYDKAELISHILKPSRSIMPGYEQASVTLIDGRVITGRIERATKLEVRIIDASGKQSNLKRSQVESLAYLPHSLMPDNLTSLITQDEFVDMIAYLASLKKMSTAKVSGTKVKWSRSSRLGRRSSSKGSTQSPSTSKVQSGWERCLEQPVT